MKILFTIIITALLAGGGVYWWQNSLQTAPKKVGQTTVSPVVEFNCKQSGGLFSKGQCDCSSLKDEFATYEASTGYCLTADGSPGGEVGETMKQLLELKMLKNK